MWADGEKIKKAIKCSAPEYVDYLMTWVQEQLDNEQIFPSKVNFNTFTSCLIEVEQWFKYPVCLFFLLLVLVYQVGVPFPKNFVVLVSNIFKRLFRVYAHIYHSHFPKIVSLGEEAHLNTSFKVYDHSLMCFLNPVINNTALEPFILICSCERVERKRRRRRRRDMRGRRGGYRAKPSERFFSPSSSPKWELSHFG